MIRGLASFNTLTGDQSIQSLHRDHSFIATMEFLRDNRVPRTGRLRLYASPSFEMREFYRLDGYDSMPRHPSRKNYGTAPYISDVSYVPSFLSVILANPIR